MKFADILRVARNVSATALMLLLCPLAFCSPNFRWNVTTDVGIKSSCVDEFVYEDGERISLLEWGVPVMPYVGFGVEILLWNFILDAEHESAVPIKNGGMKDYDFLTGASGVVSHFSSHDLYVDKDFSVDARLGWLIQGENWWRIIPFAGFAFQNRKYSAHDGYLQYPVADGSVWSGTEEKTVLSGTVISYEQAIWFPFVGIALTAQAGDKIELGTSAIFYPYVYAHTLDNHFLRQMQFYDTMSGGNGGEVELWLKVSAERYDIGVKVSFSYEYIECEGDTSSAGIGISSGNFVRTENAGSGTKAENISFSIGMVFAKPN